MKFPVYLHIFTHAHVEHHLLIVAAQILLNYSIAAGVCELIMTLKILIKYIIFYFFFYQGF